MCVVDVFKGSNFSARELFFSNGRDERWIERERERERDEIYDLGATVFMKPDYVTL